MVGAGDNGTGSGRERGEFNSHASMFRKCERGGLMSF